MSLTWKRPPCRLEAKITAASSWSDMCSCCFIRSSASFSEMRAMPLAPWVSLSSMAGEDPSCSLKKFVSSFHSFLSLMACAHGSVSIIGSLLSLFCISFCFGFAFISASLTNLKLHVALSLLQGSKGPFPPHGIGSPPAWNRVVP